MSISIQLLHQIADPTITHDERARLRCQLAKELEDIGNYEAAREAMGEVWPCVEERPILDGLNEAMAGEVLLRAGVLCGWIGSTRQTGDAQEKAKDLITESIHLFEELEDRKKVAEALTDLGYCYWREGAFDEARAALRSALARVPESDTHRRAVALLRSAMVERSTARFSDALRIHLENARPVEESASHALKGKYHNELALVLRSLSAVERHPDYIDRALIEYAAASYHFEQAGHRRYQACVENNLGFLFGTIKRFPEAHEHLDRAQVLFTGMKDIVHTAQVDDTRAKVLLAEGRVAEAERIVRSAVKILEKGDQQSLLAEALTTHGVALARMGSHQLARLTLQNACVVAQKAGDSEGAGLAALTALEELAEQLSPQDLCDTYDLAAELLSPSENRDTKDRLLAASRQVLFLAGALAAPPRWEGFSFFDAVRRFEARLIERALREAGGVVSRAAELLGIGRQSLDTMLHRGRHKALAHLRTPVEPRRSSLMFRHSEECSDARTVSVLHVEDNALVADSVRGVLEDEGWAVETCREGACALERLEGGARYDVLIFDNRLPDTNGVELTRQTRALAHRKQTPIIILSGEDVEARARRAGANAFLRKPDDVRALAETVARLLARKSKQH